MTTEAPEAETAENETGQIALPEAAPNIILEDISMRVCIASIMGLSIYSQGAPLKSAKGRNESYDEFEKRVWKERCNVREAGHPDEGHIYVPGQAFKGCLASGARYMSEKIKGKGNATWTKHFYSGVHCDDGLSLVETLETVSSINLFVPSDGKKGSSAKVWKTFPVIQSWAGDVKFQIVDSQIQEEVFERYLQYAGLNIGVGRWRPENGGSNGMFKVTNFVWQND